MCRQCCLCHFYLPVQLSGLGGCGSAGWFVHSGTIRSPTKYSSPTNWGGGQSLWASLFCQSNLLLVLPWEFQLTAWAVYAMLIKVPFTDCHSCPYWLNFPFIEVRQQWLHPRQKPLLWSDNLNPSDFITLVYAGSSVAEKLLIKHPFPHAQPFIAFNAICHFLPQNIPLHPGPHVVAFPE